MATKLKGWKFNEAQTLVAAMRAKVNSFGYEITVGGSVLTKGESANDLDLFFVPKSSYNDSRPIELLIWLASKLGIGKTIISNSDPASDFNLEKSFTHTIRFDLGGRKVDVFVI